MQTRFFLSFHFGHESPNSFYFRSLHTEDERSKCTFYFGRDAIWAARPPLFGDGLIPEVKYHFSPRIDASSSLGDMLPFSHRIRIIHLFSLYFLCPLYSLLWRNAQNASSPPHTSSPRFVFFFSFSPTENRFNRQIEDDERRERKELEKSRKNVKAVKKVGCAEKRKKKQSSSF